MLVDNETIDHILSGLSQSNARAQRAHPGEAVTRQPLHVVYGGAHLFDANTPVKLGEIARRTMQTYAPDWRALVHGMGLPGDDTLASDPAFVREIADALQRDAEALKEENVHAWLGATVYERVHRKLATEPVEDFRIDFEDGYGIRSDDEEDAAAVRAATETARAMNEGLLPPFFGIRIKPLNEELKARSARTLVTYFSTLAEATNSRLPESFVVTLPKITTPEQVHACVEIFEHLEDVLDFPPGAIGLEIMVETTESLFTPQGDFALPLLMRASAGRLVGAHLGSYDYTASCNITAAHQSIDHPACDFAKHLMQIAFANTGVFLSDGATNIMPVPPHRPPHHNAPLTETQRQENTQAVHRAWRLMVRHVWHSLRGGFYQGWDLHPAQLPARYAACFSFFLEGLPAAAERLGTFVQRATQASLVGNVFDDAATGQGLLNTFLRATNSGAISPEDLRQTGLSLEEIQSRSFVKILEGRSKRVEP